MVGASRAAHGLSISLSTSIVSTPRSGALSESMRAATKRDQGEIPTSRPRAKLSSTGGLPITATDPSRDSIIPSPRNSWKLDGDLSWARAIHAPASLRAPKPLQLTTHPGIKLDVVSAD